MALAVVSSVATAAPSTLESRQWSLSEGLPQSTVTGIVADADGFLLLGTFGGIARFDGRGFEALPLDLRLHPNITRVTAIAAAPNGVWFSAQDGGLWLWDGSRAVRVEQPESLRDVSLTSLHAFDDGALLASSDRGAFHRSATGAWVELYPGATSDVDVDGSAYWMVADGRVGRIERPGGTVRWLWPDAGSGGASRGAVDVAGRYWFAAGRDLHVVDASGLRWTVPLPDGAEASYTEPIFDAEGGFWWGSNLALYHLRDAQAQLEQLMNGSPPGFEVVPVESGVRSIFIDPTGGTWVGTSSSGLVSFDEALFRPAYVVPGDRAYGPLALSSRAAGAAWSASCDVLIHLDGESGERFPLRLPSDGCIEGLLDLGDGRLLLGGEWGLIIHRPDAMESVPDRRWADGPREAVSTLARAPDGRVVVGTRTGHLFMGDVGSGWSVLPMPEGMGRIYSVFPAADGLWVGTANGLVRIEQGRATVFTADDGLAPGAVRGMALDDDGRLWAATYGGGLGWVDAQGAGHIGVGVDDLPNGHLSAIAFDGFGRAWIHGNHGVFVTERARLQDRARGAKEALSVVVLDVGESNGWIQPSMLALDAGRLLLANVDRWMQVHPDAFAERDAPGKVVLREFSVGGIPFSGDALVPASVGRDLRLRLAAPGLHGVGDTQFEWRLLPYGGSAPWNRVGPTGWVNVPELAPGKYFFEARSRTADGRVGEALRVQLTVVPYVWERRGVVVAGVSLVAAAALFLGYARARALLFQNATLREEIQRRIRAEALAEQQGTYYRTLFESSAAPLLLFSPEGRCAAANPRAVALHDSAGAGLIGVEASHLGLGPVVASAEPQRTETLVDARTLDGRAFPAQVIAVRFPMEGEDRVLCSVIDITRIVESEQERTRLRDALHTARRLEGVGRLAGGVAHDINNMMTAILCNTDLASERVGEGPARRHLDEIRLAIARGAALIRELLSFGRRPQVDVVALDPNGVIEQMAGLLRRMMPADVTLELLLSAIPPIRLPQTALEQIVMNLVVNAADAIPSSGRVTVRTRRDDAQVVLEVADDGVGMTPEVAARIFEPYFSTKAPERGTGLGLATVHDLAAAAQATVEVDTAPGQGTTFRLRFPAASDIPVRAAEAAAPSSSRASARGQTILVVDDNAAVLSAMVEALLRAGFRVESFADPGEALRWAEEAEHTPELVVSDVIMPGMNGKQMLEKIRHRHPRVGALFVTGYSADVVFQRGVSAQVDELLEKPFTARQLVERVQQLIDA